MEIIDGKDFLVNLFDCLKFSRVTRIVREIC